MKNLNETIQTEVANSIEKLLKSISAPTTVWQAYFCALEELQSEFPMLGRWSLRIQLAGAILDKGLVVAEELAAMQEIYYNAHDEMAKANEANMCYMWGETQCTACVKKIKQSVQTPPEIVLDEKFESVMKSVLRPFVCQKQKSLEVIMERAQRRCESRMPIVRPEAITEFALDWGLENGLFAIEDVGRAHEVLNALKEARR